MTNMTYAETGVDYGAMDPFKRLAQLGAQYTDHTIERMGYSVIQWTRGESAFLIETPFGYLGFVVEGLGTKSIVADAMRIAAHMESETFYKNIAQCNAAMAFNDLVTLGALPLIYSQYVAVGESEWFNDDIRRQDLVLGTKDACLLAGCVWGGGETPTLKGIIEPGTVDLAGATVGIISPKTNLIDPSNIRHGDAIIIVESNGVHANGFTLCREIAKKLPKGYLTELPDGRTYGETLLDPTHIYVAFIEECFDRGVDLHYTVNITGHGWRKFMRAVQPFTYVIDTLPTQLPIFDFIQEHGPVNDKEAYGNFNMGAGFAVYVSENDVEKAIKCAENQGIWAFKAGYIEDGDKKVVIRPNELEYVGDTLSVR